MWHELNTFVSVDMEVHFPQSSAQQQDARRGGGGGEKKKQNTNTHKHQTHRNPKKKK